MIRHIVIQTSDMMRAKLMGEVSIYDPYGLMRVDVTEEVVLESLATV